MGKGHAGADGEGKSITNKTFVTAGSSMEQTEEVSKKNALNLLHKVLGETPSGVVKDPSGFDRYDDAPHDHSH